MNVQVDDLIRDGVRELSAVGPLSPRPESKGMINLRFNENVFGAAHRRYPDNALDNLVRHYVAALESVDPPPPRLRQLQEWSPENVLITRGAVDALSLVLRTFFEPGSDMVAVTPPNFEFFDRLAVIHGITRCTVPLGGWRFDRLDVDRLLALPVKGILLCDPNNPSSTLLDAGDLLALLAHFDGIVVIDETYAEFAGRPSHRHRLAEHDNLIVLRSMSKAFGMASLRLGAVLAHPSVISAVRKVQSPFGVPGPVIDRALEELADLSTLGRRIQAFVEERDWLADALARSLHIGRIFAEAGFVTIEVADVASAAAALRRAHIATVVEPEGLQHRIRIAVGSRQDNLRLITALSLRNDDELAAASAVKSDSII